MGESGEPLVTVDIRQSVSECVMLHSQVGRQGTEAVEEIVQPLSSLFL